MVAIINEAQTAHEVEQMRQVVIEARAYIEKKAYAAHQQKWKEKNGGHYEN
jgi:hypothetical protein